MDGWMDGWPRQSLDALQGSEENRKKNPYSSIETDRSFQVSD